MRKAIKKSFSVILLHSLPPFLIEGKVRGQGTYLEIAAYLRGSWKGQEDLIHHLQYLYVSSFQYNCLCKEGFSGDGKTCLAIDPCLHVSLVEFFPSHWIGVYVT